MAKPNPSFQKRLRERQKKQKREEKLRKRAERTKDGTGGDDVVDLNEVLGLTPEGDEIPPEEETDEEDEDRD